MVLMVTTACILNISNYYLSSVLLLLSDSSMCCYDNEMIIDDNIWSVRFPSSSPSSKSPPFKVPTAASTASTNKLLIEVHTMYYLYHVMSCNIISYLQPPCDSIHFVMHSLVD